MFHGNRVIRAVTNFSSQQSFVHFFFFSFGSDDEDDDSDDNDVKPQKNVGKELKKVRLPSCFSGSCCPFHT